MTEVLRWGDAGPHVVLVHGAGLGAGVWFRVGPELAALGFRVTAPHLLGYGARPAPDGFSVADDVGWIAAHCGPSTHLFGHSYGGYVALQVARSQPLARLTVYEPVAFSLLGDDLSEAHRALAADPRFSDPRTGGDESWMRAFVEYWQGPGAWDALPAKARARQLGYGRRAFENVSTVHENPVPLAAYEAIAAPTTVMHGERTTSDAKGVCALLVEAIPGAHGIEVPGAGHMGPVTHVASLLAALVGQPR